MRYRKRPAVLAMGLALCLLAAGWMGAGRGGFDDERLFQEAKILIFDKRWEEAQEKLDELMDEYPDSPYYAQSLFYKGRCLLEQEDEERYAIRIFKEYMDHEDRNEKLVEEAEIAIIDLSYSLFERGKKSYSEEIEKRLDSPNLVVRYYAAVKMSFLEDNKVARRAIPVLQDILEDESSDELRDRARIALLRIDPRSIERTEREREQPRAKGRMLHFVVSSPKEGGVSFELSIPWALADLALGAIPSDAKEEMRKEGYNLEKIVRELNEFSGKMIEIKSEGTLIKIWIE